LSVRLLLSATIDVGACEFSAEPNRCACSSRRIVKAKRSRIYNES
jgi:hypothetical protein